MSLLSQLGVVGYDQWQVSSNGGSYLVAGIPVAASRLPYYTGHGIGVQANVILPAKNLLGFLKYYDEYRALARPQGRTIDFGFSWTLRFRSPRRNRKQQLRKVRSFRSAQGGRQVPWVL